MQAGSDAQQHNYDSRYSKPFRTLKAALAAANMCDRILLRRGQVHSGPVGIYAPNVTIMAEPLLPSQGDARPLLRCAAAGPERPCIIMGEGLYGGAAHITLSGFDVHMTGSSGATCIQLNEGQGGGSSPYWSYFVRAAGKEAWARPYTLLQVRSGVSCACAILGLYNLYEHNMTTESLAASGVWGPTDRPRPSAHTLCRTWTSAAAATTALSCPPSCAAWCCIACAYMTCRDRVSKFGVAAS